MRNPRDVWGLMLTALVFGHLAVAMVHGQAHRGAEVGLSTAGNVFDWLVIIAGPVLGWLWWKTAGGAAGKSRGLG